MGLGGALKTALVFGIPKKDPSSLESPIPRFFC